MVSDFFDSVSFHASDSRYNLMDLIATDKFWFPTVPLESDIMPRPQTVAADYPVHTCSKFHACLAVPAAVSPTYILSA